MLLCSGKCIRIRARFQPLKSEYLAIYMRIVSLGGLLTPHMRNATLLLSIGLLMACQPDKTPEIRIREYSGTACESCPVVQVSIPEMSGDGKLETSVNTALREEIIELLDYDEEQEALDIPVIASLNGVTRSGWISHAQELEQAGADALELNLYFTPHARSAAKASGASRAILKPR